MLPLQHLQDLESQLPTLCQQFEKCWTARKSYRQTFLTVVENAGREPFERFRADFNEAIALMASCDECLTTMETALHIGYETWGMAAGRTNGGEAEVTDCLLRASSAHEAFRRIGIVLPNQWRYVWEQAKLASTDAELKPLLDAVEATEKELCGAVEMQGQVYDLWQKTTAGLSKRRP